MSSISPEFELEYGFDPEGTDPLVDRDDPERWVDDRTAEGATVLFAGPETQRWFDWLLGSGLVSAGWERHGDEALLELWTRVLFQVQEHPFHGCSWKEIASEPPVPLWLRLNPGFEKYLGLQGCRLAAGIIAAVCRWMEVSWGAEWRALPSYGRISPAGVGLLAPQGRGIQPYDVIPRKVWGAASGRDRDCHPESLLEWARRFAPGTGGDATPNGGGEPEFALDPWGDGRWNWGLSTDDWTAHMEEDRFERLAMLLGQAEGISDCIHEDRELILFRSELGHDTLMSIIEQLWEQTAPEGNA